MGYVDKLNEAKKSEAGKAALGKMSAGELAWNVAGGVGGGALGYALAKLLHNRPDTETKLLYALGGAGVGVGGVNYALSNIGGTEGFGGSLRDEMRLHDVANNTKDPTIPERSDNILNRVFTRPGLGVYGGAAAGAIGGASWNGRNWLNPADWGEAYDYSTQTNTPKKWYTPLISSGEGARRRLETDLRKKLRDKWLNFSPADAVDDARKYGYDPTLPANTMLDVTVTPGIRKSLVRRGVGALSGAALLGLAMYGAQTGINVLGNPIDTAVTKDKILSSIGKRDK